jgi:hypothetical protein
LEIFFPIIGKILRFFHPLENFFPMVGKFFVQRKPLPEQGFLVFWGHWNAGSSGVPEFLPGKP